MWNEDPIEKMGDSVGMEFLPLGKGALILILGGLVALMLSLLWSLLSPRVVPTGYQRTVPRSPTGVRPLGALVRRQAAVVSASAFSQEQRGAARRIGARWPVDLAEATLRMGYGHPDIQVVGPTRYAVRLPTCRSCSGAVARREGCVVERRTIERAVRASVPGAAVVESRCRAIGHESCRFEVMTGAVP